MSEKPAGWLLALVASECNWDASDYLRVDEIAGLVRDRPEFGSDAHRILSTILLLQTELETLKEL